MDAVTALLSDELDVTPVRPRREHKRRGWRVLNGNVSRERDLVGMFAPLIVAPDHFDEAVNASRKVLLVTAAFQPGHEYRDRHLIALFEDLEIDARWAEGFPTNIQNLSVATFFEAFKKAEPWLYRRYTEKQDILKAVKRDYHAKIHHHVTDLMTTCGRLGERYPALGLYEFVHVDDPNRHESLVLNPPAGWYDERALAQIEALRRSGPDRERAGRVRRLLEHLRYRDREIYAILEAIEHHFLEESGVTKATLYREQRAELEGRILSSASVFLFGGRVYVLANRLRFYQLASAFASALERGTNIFGVSAGSMVQTDRFSLAFEDLSPTANLVAADFGMGLVSGIRVLPHAEDFRFVRESDRNTLSFFALRQDDAVAVALSERAVLLCETYEAADGRTYERFTSAGADPALVFGPRGYCHSLEPGDELLMPGSRFFAGRPQIARLEEIREMEAAADAQRSLDS